MSSRLAVRLLPLVTALPAGEKLHIGSLARALAPTQAQVIAAIAELVESGQLDRRTLRPPRTGRTGAELAEEMIAEGARRGLSICAVSLTAFGNASQLYIMRKSERPVYGKTLAKIRAWLAAPPAAIEIAPEREPMRPPEAGKEEAGGEQRARPTLDGRARAAHAPPASEPPRVSSREREPKAGAKAPSAPDAHVSGADLATMLDSAIAAHGLSKAQVGRHLFKMTSGVEQLRRVAQPQGKTVARVRAFVADPPVDALRSRAPLGDRRFAANRQPRRDPTEKPDTPLLDAADRQRLNGQRYHAAIRRGQEREAAEALDAGVDPSSVKGTFKANTMRQIQRRREDEARQTDPLEQAKIALRQRGRVVHAAEVTGGPAGQFMVDRKLLSASEVIALAEQQSQRSATR